MLTIPHGPPRSTIAQRPTFPSRVIMQLIHVCGLSSWPTPPFAPPTPSSSATTSAVTLTHAAAALHRVLRAPPSVHVVSITSFPSVGPAPARLLEAVCMQNLCALRGVCFVVLHTLRTAWVARWERSQRACGLFPQRRRGVETCGSRCRGRQLLVIVVNWPRDVRGHGRGGRHFRKTRNSGF